MKACIVSTDCLTVSLLIVLIKILQMKLFVCVCVYIYIYIHLSHEMNAWCNNSGVQENLDNSEYHVIQSTTFLSITHRILCTP